MAATRTSKTEMVGAQYRLPVTLFKCIKIAAVHRGVRPSVIVEEMLTEGLKRQRSTAQDPELAASPAAQ